MRMRAAIFRRKPHVDLSLALPDAGIEFLLLDHIPRVSGWRRLQDLDQLSKISMVQCGSSEDAPAVRPRQLRELYLHTLTQSCLKTIAALTQADDVTIRHSETPLVHMAMLRHHTGLRKLFLYCGLAVGFAPLVGFPLEEVHITNVEMDEEFLRTLKSWKGLRELWLENEQSFGPDRLPELPGLKKLRIPAYPEFREEWIKWAASHPKVTFKFQPVTESYGKMPSATIEEIYRDVAVLKLTKGRRIWYEAWEDFTDKSPIPGNNHDLREWLKGRLARVKKRVRLFSEADELGLSASRLEDIKWCIDALLDGNVGPDGKAAPKGRKKKP
jgi:hypothetical protein